MARTRGQILLDSTAAKDESEWEPLADADRQEECHFMSMPPEIRHEIYKHVFKAEKQITVVSPAKSGLPAVREKRYIIHTSLLQTCRAIYNETAKLPFMTSVHHLGCPNHGAWSVSKSDTEVDYFSKMQQWQVRAVQRIMFHVSRHDILSSQPLSKHWARTIFASLTGALQWTDTLKSRPDLALHKGLMPKEVTILLGYGLPWRFEHFAPPELLSKKSQRGIPWHSVLEKVDVLRISSKHRGQTPEVDRQTEYLSGWIWDIGDGQTMTFSETKKIRQMKSMTTKLSDGNERSFPSEAVLINVEYKRKKKQQYGERFS